MDTRWLYVTAEEFPQLRELAKETCIVPLGCVEKHGLHLPVGQDIMQVSHIAYEASKLEPVCVFPDVAFGDINGGTNPDDGYIEMPLELRNLMLDHFCDQIARNGYKKIIIYNGHGGNSAWLSSFLRKLEDRKHDYVVVVVMIKLQAPHMMAEKILAEGRGCIPELTTEDEDLLLKYHAENMKIGHGGFGETSYMMGIAPDCVHMEYLGRESGLGQNLTQKFSDAGIQLRDSGWFVNYPNAFSGHDPIGCNERIGKAAVRLEAERLANAIKVMKEDEDLLRWHGEKQARYK